MYILYMVFVYLMAKERTSKIFIFFLLMKLNWILEFFFSHFFLIVREADSKMLLSNKTITKKTLLISRSFSCLEWLKTKINISLKTWFTKNWINKASAAATQPSFTNGSLYKLYIWTSRSSENKIAQGGKRWIRNKTDTQRIKA